MRPRGATDQNSRREKKRSGKTWQFPKRKMSRANTRTRRSTWKADLTELNTVKVAGREIRVPRRLAKAYKNGLLDVEG